MDSPYGHHEMEEQGKEGDGALPLTENEEYSPHGQHDGEDKDKEGEGDLPPVED